MVRMLIAEFKADMTIQNEHGGTALMLATNLVSQGQPLWH